MRSDSSELQRILLDNADTVTHLLETLTGEPIVVDVVRNSSRRASADNDLGVGIGQVLVHRIALLKGRTTDRPYLYAESLFVPDRLPEEVRFRLEQTSDPIGRVLGETGSMLEREPLPQPEILEAHIGDHTFEVAWSRAYRLVVDGVPMFAISEWFLRGVIDAMRARGHFAEG